MNILNAQGLYIQGTGPGNAAYGVAHYSKTVTFTYSAFPTDIMTISVSSGTPTNFMISTFMTHHGDKYTNNTNGPQSNYYINTWYLNSSGIFVTAGSAGMFGQGTAYQSTITDTATVRTIKLQVQGTSSTNSSMAATYHVLLSCSDFSRLTVS